MKFWCSGKNNIKKKAAARSRASFSQNLRNASSFFSKKKTHGRESQCSSGCSAYLTNSHFKCPSDAIFDDGNSGHKSICAEEIQRKWSLQQLFAMEDSWGKAFPAILWNADLRCKLSSSQLPLVSPASCGRQRDEDGAEYNNPSPETSDNFVAEGPSVKLDVAVDPAFAGENESEGTISSSQNFQPPVSVSCELSAEGAGGSQGIGLSLEDITLLYENGEMDEEDLLAFVKATCLSNRDDLCKLLDSVAISSIQE